MQEYTLVPKDRNQILEANKWDQKIHNGIIRRKMIDFLPVALVVNDKNQYAISFLDLHQNRIDLSSCFYGNDSEAHDWCENLFYHYWKTSTEWDESKIKTVDFESLSKKR